MSDRKPSIRPWQTVAIDARHAYRVFSVETQRCRSPRTGEDHDFYVIDSGDWVNVIPLTPEGRVVMIRQYRHGIRDITLEVPGGLVEPGDTSPVEAARRELREETGYDSDVLVFIGAIHPNPAIQNNRCHSFLAQNAVRRFETKFDGTEETEVVLVPLDRVPELIREGAISHALVVVAFHHLMLARTGS